jgi:uncharacterized membrane protein YkoI
MKLNVVFKKIALASLLSLAMACGSAGLGSAEDAKAKATSLVPGQALGAQKEQPPTGPALWVVQVKLASGAVVTVELDSTTGALVEVKDHVGPFGYELQPVKEALKLSEATQKALAEKPMSTVIAWEIKADGAGWEYEFYVRDVNERLWEIKMTGDKGVVKSVVEKAAID